MPSDTAARADSRMISVADHSKTAPTYFEADGAPTWVSRGSNFVIAITQAKAGTRIASGATPDEHMILLPDTGASIATRDGRRDVDGYHLVIVPPGDCEIVSADQGLIVRCFSSRRVDLVAMASNAADFAVANPDVAPLVDWPAPPSGFITRLYPLARYLVANERMRIFRSTNLMINVLRERPEPRDIRALTPHSHETFEQASISIQGTHVHHLRRPWTPDMTLWVADEALEVGSPSVVVIPPKVIHTTRNIGASPALLVDLFAPPRVDFSLRPGGVCNADDYPLPADVAAR